MNDHNRLATILRAYASLALVECGDNYEIYPARERQLDLLTATDASWMEGSAVLDIRASDVTCCAVSRLHALLRHADSAVQSLYAANLSRRDRCRLLDWERK